MSGFILTPAELAYLLASLGAHTIPGDADSQLFPEDSEQEQALLNEGFALLQEHGWLQPVEEGGFDLNSQLLLTVAIIADPYQVIIATRHLPDGAQQVISYFLDNEMIVELYLTAGRQYHITPMRQFNTAVSRLAVNLDIPEHLEGTPVIVLEKNLLERVLALVERGQARSLAEVLVEHGIEGRVAKQWVDALTSMVRVVDIVLLQVVTGNEAGRRELSLFTSGKAFWLVSEDASGVVTFSPATFGHFQAVLQDNLQALHRGQSDDLF